MEKKQSIGAAWIKKTKNGDSFLSLTIEGKKYTLFKNKYKTEDKQPDYRVFEDTYTGTAKNTGQFVTPKEVIPPMMENDNDLPF
jgi:uncharacterized protein (DUF736 family)